MALGDLSGVERRFLHTPRWREKLEHDCLPGLTERYPPCLEPCIVRTRCRYFTVSEELLPAMGEAGHFHPGLVDCDL